MKKIALTGNIGSGKSTVSMIFHSMGIPVFVADTEAKKLYSEKVVQEKIKSLFGNSVFDAGNSVDFKKLADIIFNNGDALKAINSFIHPLVLSKYNSWLSQNQDSLYTIHESAIIFENRLQKHFDKIITVSAPENIRLERIISRDNLSKEIIQERMKNQISDEEKCQLSDYVIINDGNNLLIPQVLLLHSTLIKK